MAQNIKQAIKREYLKCAQDSVYFMKKYCTIQHPQKGKIKFNLYDFQENTLKDIIEHRYNIILKSRQLGISTLVAGYSLWLMLFNADKNILCIAKDRDTAKNLVTKVRVMYSSLPQWLKTVVDEDNKQSLRFANGSQIKAVAATTEAGRSEALSLLILDEAAFNDKIDDCKYSNDGLPKENEIVVVKGRKMDDAVFADIMTVQDNKVYTKLSDLKKGA